MSESVVATGALPLVKYINTPSGTRMRPSMSPAMNFKVQFHLSEFHTLPLCTRTDGVFVGILM
jgi:hypothetical protein